MALFWSNFSHILVGALAAAMCAFFVYLWKEFTHTQLFSKISEMIEVRVDEADAAELEKLITQCVEAADQLVKNGTIEKDERFKYVTDRIEDVGVQVTEIIKAKIESNVKKLPSLDEN